MCELCFTCLQSHTHRKTPLFKTSLMYQSALPQLPAPIAPKVVINIKNAYRVAFFSILSLTVYPTRGTTNATPHRRTPPFLLIRSDQLRISGPTPPGFKFTWKNRLASSIIVRPLNQNTCGIICTDHQNEKPNPQLSLTKISWGSYLTLNFFNSATLPAKS